MATSHPVLASSNNRTRRQVRPARALLHGLLALLIIAAMLPKYAFALSAADISISLVTPFMAQDSNSSCSAGPKAMYIEALVTNPAGGTGTLSNLSASIGSFTGTAGVTLDSGEVPSRYIGTLADGASFPLYFYINYPCQAGSNPPALTSNFTVTVSDGTPQTVATALQLTTRSEVSANAGGTVLSSTIGPGAVVGQIIPMTVQYDFGNPGGDKLAMIQPAGNVSFDSGCFRLMSADITSVTGFTAGLTTAADDRLYFTAVAGAASNTATVVYYFKMMCSGASTTANPFSDLTSGGQLKYTGNFGTCSSAGAICPAYPPPTNPFVITKSASPSSLPTGGTATYTVTINNPSAYAAKIDQILDVLPAGVTFAAISATSDIKAANSSAVPTAGASGTLTFAGVPTTSCVGGVCNGSYNIAANGSLKLIYTANVSSAAGTYTNSASAGIGSVTIGPVSANVSVGSADLAITKTASASTPNVGSNVTFTVQVTNNGTSATSGVQVTDLLPAGLTLVSAGANQGTYTSGTGVWSIGSMAVGAVVTLTITATVTQAGAITNSATITGSNVPDPTAGNNNASVTITGQQADLAVTKTVSNSNPTLGSQIVYTVQVRNNGPSTATGVEITDALPAGMAYVSANATLGSYDNVTGVWTVSSLASGATATLAITVQVNDISPITNTASVTKLDQSDPNTSNNTDSVTTPASLANLSVTKTVNKAAPNVGENVTFTLTAGNAGPSTATNVVIGDLLPSGLSFVSASLSQGSYNSVTGVWTVGSLANGSSTTLTIVATVTQPGTITNFAAVLGSDQIDPNSANDTASASVTGQQADLAVTKTVNNAAPNVGSDVTFTVQVRNNGPNTATNVAISDLLPAGLAFVSASSGSYNNATGVWTVGSLANGISASLQIVASVVQAGSMTNSASVSASDQYDPDTSDNTGSASVTGQQADLSLSKTVSPATPNVGANATFTVQISNNGPSTATGISATDLLPAGLTLVSASPSQGSYNNATGVWTVGSLANGSGATLQIVATVAQPGAITNSAGIATASQPDPNPANNTDSAVVTGQQSDLAVTKAVSNATPNVGSDVTFTVQAINNGPSAATGVAISDLLPAGLAFVSASSGSYDSATGVWSVGSLANGAVASLTIVATVLQAGPITNSASVSASDQPDVNSANNTATASLSGQQADLAVAKSVDNAAPNVGSNVTFTVQARNNGPSTATGVALTDVLPAGMAFVSASPSQGSYSSATGVWTVGSLANGATATLTIVATITQPGIQTNTASVTASGQPDPVAANNIGSASVQGQQANLAVTKTVNNATPNVGSNVTFSVQVVNNGPSAATGVALTDVLPAGLAFVSASATVGVYDSATGVWSVGGLANGATATLTLVATVTQPGGIVNNATVTASDQPDPSSINNTATASLMGQQADLAVTKTVDNATPNVGSNVTFSVQVTNNGPSTASGVQLTDVLPAGLAFVSASATTGSYDSGTGVWSVGALANGTTATLTLVATVTQPGAIVNSAVITAAGQPDPTPANNGASASVTGQEADLAVTKSVDNPTPNVGSNVTFTVQVTNNGSGAATGVALTDLLPAGLTFVSSFAGQGTYNSVTGVWSVGGLANGASATLQLEATVTQPSAITNTVAVTAAGQPDQDSSNNVASASVTGQQADLAVTKSVDNPTPNVGSNVTFSVQVTNNGPSDATGVLVNDPLPAGLTYVSHIATPGTYDDATGVWNVGDLANGAIKTLTIVASVAQPGVIVNTASAASANQPDQDGTNNIASATVIGKSADLAVSKTVDEANPSLGDSVIYTVQIRNNGPSDATGIVVVDVLPAGMAFVADNPSVGSYNTGTGVWAIGDLANGATATLAIEAIVIAPGAITNTAAVSAADQPDPNPGNNSGSVTTPQSVADLSVLKTVDVATPNVGQQALFTVQVTNNGPDSATNVSLSDLLPAGLTLVSASPSQGGYNGSTGVWTIGGLLNGQTETLDMLVVVTQPGAFTNHADVIDLDQVDPNLGNNTGQANVIGQQSDLAVTKTADNAAPNIGSNVTFTVQVTNNGPSDATGVQVSDLLPAGLAYVGDNPSQGTYTVASGLWDVGSLANGASETLVIVAAVLQAGPTTNSATSLGADQPDANAANNADSATVTGQQADLLLSKSVNNTAPSVGSDVVFTILLANNGPSTATGIVVADVLPAGLTYVSDNPSQGSYDSFSGLWSAGSLASGGIATLQIVATVTVADVVTNVAAITAAGQPDLNPANNADIVSVIGQPADLAVTKSVDNAAPNVGSNVTFTVQVTNNGPSAASGVAVSDMLPAGLTFVSASASQGSYTSATGVWAVGNLASGASATLQVVATVTAPGTITNIASISASSPLDTNPANDTANASVGGQQADLAMTKTVDNKVPNVGSNVTFSVAVTNNGPSDATGVQVTDLLPAGLTFVSASASQGSYTSGTGVWAVGNLANGATATLTVVATVTQPGAIVNSATVTASGQPDPNSADNTAAAILGGQQADLVLAKSVDNLAPNVGANVTYTVQVTNNGPSDATGVAVTDALPAGLAFVSASASQGSYTSATGVWVVGGLADQATATLTIVATVTQPGAIVNSATVTASDQPDPTPANNGTSAALSGQAADLAVTKVVNGSTPGVGNAVIYTITVRNDGPSDATGVQVTDLLPAGLTFVSSAPSQGSYTSATGLWVVGGLANGASATLQLNVSVTGTGTIVNVAQLSASDQFDPNSAPANGNAGEDDQGQAAITAQPTAVRLTSFSATMENQQVMVRWDTAAEFNTWGFHLLRSEDGLRAHAVRVTPTLILAKGRGQAGAAYSWADTTAEAGRSYFYWLQEVEVGGATNEYGPARATTVTASAQHRVFLPFVRQ